MQNFEFYAPTKMIFGKDTHLKVGAILKDYGFHKILLHYGKGSVKQSGLLTQVISSLNEAEIKFIELGGVEPNPKIELVRKGALICKEDGIELILAVGGGSVIDSSKAIAVACKVDFDPWKFFTKEETAKVSLPVGTILTLAASGSEMSSSAVLTNEEKLLKRGFHSELNRPLFSILNPELTYTVSPYQTACGISDIMMHTLERYFSLGQNTPLTDRISEGLLKSVIEAGETVMKKPNDYGARATLMWAASISHNDLTGLGRSSFMQCHQIEHELSGLYDIVSHGAGLCIIFPAWAKYVYQSAQSRFVQYAQRVWNIEANFENIADTALKGINATEHYFESIGMPTKLSDLDIGSEQFEEMAEKCTFYGKRTLPGYFVLDKNNIIDILNLAK